MYNQLSQLKSLVWERMTDLVMDGVRNDVCRNR